MKILIDHPLPFLLAHGRLQRSRRAACWLSECSARMVSGQGRPARWPRSPDAIYDLLPAGVAACRHRKRMIWWWNTTSWPFHLSAVTNQTND